MKCWHGRNPRNSITIISICMSTSFRTSSKKRIRRNSTGRHPRLQVEITKTAMRKCRRYHYWGAAREASRLPLIVPTIAVSVRVRRFQSFLSLQTVKRFTEDGDRNIFSRRGNAPEKYGCQRKDPELYLTDLSCIRRISMSFFTAHSSSGRCHPLRRRAFPPLPWYLHGCCCMAAERYLAGSILGKRRHYGNWKPRSTQKKMFAPVLLSVRSMEIDQKPFVNTLPHPIDVSADLHVANETGELIVGTVKWFSAPSDSSVVKEEPSRSTTAYGGQWMPHLDFNGQDPVHPTYELVVIETPHSRSSRRSKNLLALPFRRSETFCIGRRRYRNRNGRELAKSVSVETENGVLRLDDNSSRYGLGNKDLPYWC